MQVVFAPARNFFRRGVISITPRRAPVERRDMRKSLMESASDACRVGAERARRAGAG